MKAAANTGVTLLELLVAMAIGGMVLAISFPSFSSGLDGVRLQATARQVAAFVNTARAWAERSQAPVEVLIEPEQSRIRALSADGQWERTLEVAGGVQMERDEEKRQRLLLIPGLPPPGFRVVLVSSRGRSLAVGLDPVTGAPQIEEPER